MPESRRERKPHQHNPERQVLSKSSIRRAAADCIQTKAPVTKVVTASRGRPHHSRASDFHVIAARTMGTSQKKMMLVSAFGNGRLSVNSVALV